MTIIGSTQVVVIKMEKMEDWVRGALRTGSGKMLGLVSKKRVRMFQPCFMKRRMNVWRRSRTRCRDGSHLNHMHTLGEMRCPYVDIVEKQNWESEPNDQVKQFGPEIRDLTERKMCKYYTSNDVSRSKSVCELIQFDDKMKIVMDLAYTCVKALPLETPNAFIRVSPNAFIRVSPNAFIRVSPNAFIRVSPNAFIRVSPNACAESATELASFAYLCSLRSHVF